MRNINQLETIAYSQDDGVATVSLNRPEKLNAFSRTMRDELVAVLDQIDADDDVRAVVVTGTGRAFCAGGEIRTIANSPAEVEPSGQEDGVRDDGGIVTLR